MGTMAGQRGDDAELPALRLLKRPTDMATVIAAVAERLGGDPANWQSGRRCDNISRAVAAYVARQATSSTLGQIAQALGYRNPSSISVACRRVQERIIRNVPLGREVHAILAKLH